MPEFGGLQIEVRCVRCGRLPTADITLYEMQNHLYICNICRLEAERKGKHIAWVKGTQVESSPLASLAMPTDSLRTRPLTSNLPPDSVFAMFELPLDTSIPQIRETTRQQMSLWMRKPDSAEKKAMINRLREWMEKIQDEQSFEAYRESLRTLTRKEGSALSVGGRSVLTAQEFLEACEKSQEGWADGERYLRTGQLRQWILFQLEDRDLAAEARRYQTQTGVSDFRALNEMLYCFVPERPFRLYQHERWQALDTVPSATTPGELATLCDTHWSIAENHLYNGTLVFWLERSRGIQGLKAYYDTALAGYATQEQDRGVGLELLLERAVPGLKKPKLVVAFDGNEGSYTLNTWDREIEHKPITVTVTNVTRGFTSVDIALQPGPGGAEPEWITMYPTTLRGRPGAGLPGRTAIALTKLEQLKRGRTYRRTLSMRVRGEHGQPSEEKFPLILHTMWFFQGLRGKLWMWGLRGGIPGLAWNFAAGALLTFLPFLLIPELFPSAFSNWYDQLGSQISFNVVLQAVATGLVDVLHFTDLFPGYSFTFPVVTGAILGFVGFWVGIGKGHTDYPDQRNASGFRQGAFWLSVLFVAVLLYRDGGYSVIGAALQNTGYYGIYRNYQILNAIQYGSGALIGWLLIFLIACILASIHYRLEKYVRNHYQALLNPAGRL
jgi:hypothetical protein